MKMAQQHICNLYNYNDTTTNPSDTRTYYRRNHFYAANDTCILNIVLLQKYTQHVIKFTYSNSQMHIRQMQTLTSRRFGNSLVFQESINGIK